MNATGGISPAKAPHRYLTRQLILSRDDRPFASEISTITEADRPLPALSSWTLTGQSCERGSDTLTHMHRESCSPTHRRSPTPKKYLNRTVVSLSEPSLASFALTEELIQSGNNLRDLGHTLVVSLKERPFWEVDSKYKKNIIYHMYRLKDHGIEIALDDYNLQREALTRFSTLNLFNYIKVSIASLDQCLKLNSNPEFFNRLHDRMVALIHNNKISFIADRVEHIEGHSLARALPFDYFQGSYYSPADHL
ncbi:EAL domain-containing protein (putative c-di-GMP-specific phosphodiesterase class I) [Pseudomonas frederiksbergensis]|uniref:EAL domain-containing protein n=1 Tax=Pseudomonas frederiksbergensis TaxID=104087 RepID=UPI003D1A3E33